MSNDKSEKPTLYEIVPEELTKFFLDGKYAGQLGRSSKYNQIGWSMYLRGIYSYIVTHDNDNEKPHHCGFCIIEFDRDNSKANIVGIRLLESDGSSDKEVCNLENTMRFWKSDLADLVPNNTEASLGFVYSLGPNVSTQFIELYALPEFYKKRNSEDSRESIYNYCVDPDIKNKGEEWQKELYDFMRNNCRKAVNEIEKTNKDYVEDYALVSLKWNSDVDNMYEYGNYKPIVETEPAFDSIGDNSNWRLGTKIKLKKIKRPS
jgi:hypothetical protein